MNPMEIREVHLKLVLENMVIGHRLALKAALRHCEAVMKHGSAIDRIGAQLCIDGIKGFRDKSEQVHIAAGIAPDPELQTEQKP